eukprot:scaffold307482_cov37-Prasinocladus_malaysianus.AAC.1
MADIPDVDLSTVGVSKFGEFEVEVIDPVAEYLSLLKKAFLSRDDVKIIFDCMWAVTAAYAKPIF